MKRLSYSVAFLLLLGIPTFSAASDNPFSVGMGSGLGITVGPSDKMCHPVVVTLPFTISIGYSFSGFAISVEGAIGWPFLKTGFAFGSIVGSYSFLDRDWIRAYALMGLGGGFGVLFSNCERGEYESYNDISGPLQLQTGIGLSISLLSWLELNTETRLRLGVPDNTDVVTLTQHFGIVFRF